MSLVSQRAGPEGRTPPNSSRSARPPGALLPNCATAPCPPPRLSLPWAPWIPRASGLSPALPPPRVEDLPLLFASLAPTPCPFQGLRGHPQPPSGSSTREPRHPLRASHPASRWSIFRHRGYSCVKKQRDRLRGSRPDGSHTHWLWFCDPGPPGHVCEMGTGPLHPGGLEDQMRSRV